MTKELIIRYYWQAALSQLGLMLESKKRTYQSHSLLCIVTLYCFCAYSCDGSKDGEVLGYGQHFYLQTLPNEGGEVWVKIFIH
jgi:hypothetical protein